MPLLESAIKPGPTASSTAGQLADAVLGFAHLHIALGQKD